MRHFDQPILFATSNTHKIDEVRAVLEPAGVALEGLGAIDRAIPPPVEDQLTFEGNAELKARYYAEQTGRACLADDSGLVVDALDGAPGVFSARYAGIDGDRDTVDPANNARLLRELQGVPDSQRCARFVCAMVLWADGSAIVRVNGVIEGRVLHTERGRNGFGYDPLFLVEHLGQSAAELTADQKNAISHRGMAARRLIDAVRALDTPTD